jgi:peroxiredoxin
LQDSVKREKRTGTMKLLKAGEWKVLMTGLFLLFFTLSCFTTMFAGERRLKAADFSLKDLNGEEIQLYDLLGEAPIVINFWATWCKPCMKELPHLNQIFLDYRERGVKVLAISEDSPWSVSKVKSTVAGNRFEFMVLLDTNGKVLRKYGLLGTPYTFVLNPEGEILYKHFGYRPGDENSLRKEIDKALAPDEEEVIEEGKASD